MGIRLKVWMSALFVLSLLTSQPAAQGYEKKDAWYGLLGVGAYTEGPDAVAHYGIGYQARLDGGIGVNLEAGILYPRNYSSSQLNLAAGGVYTFNRDQKTKPFVTFGYAWFLRDESDSGAIYFGGGIDHLIGDRWGIKLEARDSMLRDKYWDGHYFEGRFGLLFSWD